MTHPSSRVLLMLAALALPGSTGCGDSDSGPGATGECERVCSDARARCPNSGLDSDCEKIFCAMAPPQGCFDAFSASNCSEVKTGGGWDDACFPPCTTPEYVCNGSVSMTTCSVMSGTLRSITIDCGQLCAGSGMAYTGVCGEYYGSQKSTSGHAVCWCK